MEMTGPDISQYSLHRVTFKKSATTDNFGAQFYGSLRSAGNQGLACQHFTGKLIRGGESMVLIDPDHIPMSNSCRRMLVQHFAKHRRQFVGPFCRGFAGKNNSSVRQPYIRSIGGINAFFQ